MNSNLSCYLWSKFLCGYHYNHTLKRKFCVITKQMLWMIQYVMAVLAPCICNIGTRWRWVVSFMTQLLYPQRKSPSTHWIGGWAGPRAGIDTGVKRKDPNPCQESNVSHPACTPITILTELPWLNISNTSNLKWLCPDKARS